MDYDEFDIGNFEDKICVKIANTLKERPMNIFELERKLGISGSQISPKLQKMKNVGIISNIRTSDNVCYWGLQKRYRKNE